MGLYHRIPEDQAMSTDKTFQDMVARMHTYASTPITETQAVNAANRLVAFGKLAVSIRQRQLREERARQERGA